MRFLVATFTNALGLLASGIVPGIHVDGSGWQLLLSGAIFGLFNVFVRPIVLFLSFPAVILTLGLFYLVVNGLLLWLASLFLPGYRVDGLLAGILGSLVIAIFNWAMGTAFGRKAERKGR
jgi:putative membrane protein